MASENEKKHFDCLLTKFRLWRGELEVSKEQSSAPGKEIW
jgi:hypothetical protein